MAGDVVIVLVFHCRVDPVVRRFLDYLTPVKSWEGFNEMN